MFERHENGIRSPDAVNHMNEIPHLSGKPAGFGTFGIMPGCRASQVLLPQPLLIRVQHFAARYSITHSTPFVKHKLS